MGDIKYFGNSSWVMSSAGELKTNIYGLVTGRVQFKGRPEDWKGMPQLGMVHPYASFCRMEERVVRFTRGFWQVIGDFVGAEKDVTDPHYEFDPGVGTDPIETLPWFASIAGKPSAPLNGAVWRNEEGEITTTDEDGIFDRFKIFDASGDKTEYAGTEEYLIANNSTFRKSWVQKSKPSGANDPLKIVSSPPGGQAPSFGGNYNWLEHPVRYSVRAGIFDCSQLWLLSGPDGFKPGIYTGPGS